MDQWAQLEADGRGEWLETDGMGGYAMGTIHGLRTRRYHGLIIRALQPPSGRHMLLSGLDVEVLCGSTRVPLTPHYFQPGVTASEEAFKLVADFEAHPWPAWTYRLYNGLTIRQELFMVYGTGEVVMNWSVQGAKSSTILRVRPLLAGRDYHSLHHENNQSNTDAQTTESLVQWQTYPDLPPLQCLSNGYYEHGPQWYRRFLYTAERDRGLDDTEDLIVPGSFLFDLGSGATMVFAAPMEGQESLPTSDAKNHAQVLRTTELSRRQAFPSLLHQAADQYIVKRGQGSTIIAGYPWFTDWGRDTFISMRGLCLATQRIPLALSILTEWACHVSEGMLPNRFPDGDSAPEYNSVDASLWYIVAAGETLNLAGATVSADHRQAIVAACCAIAAGYRDGTRHGIVMDSADGLLRSGEPGVQLTWMDAKVGDWVVTPRIGKPVEVQALWINALATVSAWDDSFRPLLELAQESFLPAFWNPTRNCLYDVIEDNHAQGANDDRIRPNQIFAVAGLPYSLVEGDVARQIVEVVERQLWTPMGLRSLAPGEPGYTGHYGGGVVERDGAYHQGTVWPWLAGAFIEAWVTTHTDEPGAAGVATARFLQPLLDRMTPGHQLAEIADGDEPFHPNGCPFQAWSVGEVLRVLHGVLADSPGSQAKLS